MSRTLLLTSSVFLGVAATFVSSAQAHPPARLPPPQRPKVYYVPAPGPAKQLFIVPSSQLTGLTPQPPQAVTANAPVQPPPPLEAGRDATPAAVPTTNDAAPTASVFVVRYMLIPKVKQVNFADHDQAHELEEKLTNLGVKVEVLHQSSVSKVSFRCPTWLTAEFSTKEDAKELEESLRTLGFDAHTRAKN